MTYGLAPFIVMILGMLLIEKKEPGIWRKWLLGSRPFIVIHYLVPTAFGVFLGHYIVGKPVQYWHTFMLLLAVFFSFQTSVITNDIQDIRTDQLSNKQSLLNRSSLSVVHYQHLVLYFFVVSVLFALAVGYRLLLVVLLGHILHFTYSVKPFRLKRFYPISIIMLSCGALLAAVAGFTLFNTSKPFLSFPLKPALFIVLPLFLGLNFRDLADYQGDKKTEVTTLFTILGLNTGRYVNAMLILLSYLVVPVVLQFMPFFIAAIPLGILSLYLCLRKPFEEKYVFYVYFVLIALLAVLFYLNPSIIVNR